MEGAFKKPHLYAGAVVMLIVGWAFVTGGGAILHGHPSYWVVYGIGLAIGTTAILLAFVRTPRFTRFGWSVVAAIALIMLGAILWWLRPFVASDVALDALQSDERVVVDSTPGEITLTPTSSTSGVGVIFLPGAKVDARAYGSMLRPLADAGHMVVIVKEPLGIAFLSSSAAPRWAAAHPEVDTWVVAGHSLGGVVAAQNAASSDVIDDLVLWASFPASDISAHPIAALSVFGSNDMLTTPERVDASRLDLPSGTEFVEIRGAIHGFFGDYGSQPGDGDASTPRGEAQAEIISTTLDFLDR